MSEFPAVAWDQPILVQRGAAPYGVRSEQIRRAKILVEAAGGKMPKGPKAIGQRVTALAALIPGLRYATGVVIYSGLAPEPTLLMSDVKGRRGPGAPLKWSKDRLSALAERVAEMKAESPRTLTDQMALKRIRAESVAFCKERAERAGEAFTAELKKKATLPEVETLQNYLSTGRDVLKQKLPKEALR